MSTTRKTTSNGAAGAGRRCAAVLGASGLVAGLAAGLAAAPARADAPAGPEAAAPAAAAAAPRLQAAIDIEWMRVRDGAYRLFSSEDTLSTGGVSATYELARPHPRVGVAVGLGFLDGDEVGSWGGGGQSAALDLDSVYALGVASYRLWSYLAPYVAVGAGGTHGSVRLGFAEGAALEDTSFWRWSAFARAAVGLRLATRLLKVGALGPRVSLVVAGEYGFQVGTSLSFAPAPIEPSDEKLKEDRIPSSGASLGRLGRTFPFWRLRLGVAL